MEPQITTNPYTLKASEFSALYISEIIRKAWFIFLPIFGIMLGSVIYEFIQKPSWSSLIPFGIFAIVFFWGRYRLINGLKKNPVMDRSRILKLYEHCLELEADNGMITQFFLVDITSVSPSRKHFRVRIKNGQTFWFPKSCFKTSEDLLKFEVYMKEKGKMK